MHESGEMYLETILVLGQEMSIVRAIDVANKMNFAKASVSKALGKLKENECIIIEQNGNIALTDKGKSIAEKIYNRHKILVQALRYIGVDMPIAIEDACRIEHYISDETYEAVKEFVGSKNDKE